MKNKHIALIGLLLVCSPTPAKPPLFWWGDLCCWDNAFIHQLFNLRLFVECLIAEKQDMVAHVDTIFQPKLKAFIELCETITKTPGWYNEQTLYPSTTPPFKKYHQTSFTGVIAKREYDIRSHKQLFFDYLGYNFEKNKPLSNPCIKLFCTTNDGILGIYLQDQPGLATSIADQLGKGFFPNHKATLSTFLVIAHPLEISNKLELNLDLTEATTPESSPIPTDSYFYELIGIAIYRNKNHYVSLIKDQWEAVPSWWFVDDMKGIVEPIALRDLPKEFPSKGRWSSDHVALVIYQRIAKQPEPQQLTDQLIELAQGLKSLAQPQ